MFNTAKAFSSFSVRDTQEAKKFYRDILGLEIGQEMMGMFELKLASGTSVMIYPKDNHEPASFTVLNFPVSNIDEAVDYLHKKGVGFERYEGFDQDEKGISRSSDPEQGPSVAWFKDPSGNILAVMSEVGL